MLGCSLFLGNMSTGNAHARVRGGRTERADLLDKPPTGTPQTTMPSIVGTAHLSSGWLCERVMPDCHFMSAGEAREGPHVVYRETRSDVNGKYREQPYPDVKVRTIYGSPIAHVGNEQALRGRICYSMMALMD